MSVEASFIDGLLAVSGGNDGGSSDADGAADSGAGNSTADAGSEQDQREQRPDPSVAADAEVGAKQAAESQPSAGDGKQAEPVARPAETEKPADDQPKAHIDNLKVALREVRGENKQLKESLAKQAEEFASLKAQIEALSKPKQPDPEPEPEPDFLSDPKAVIDKLAKRLEDTGKRIDESEQQRKQREENEAKQRETEQKARENWNRIVAAEAEFVSSTPDYWEALKHVRGVLTAQAKIANPEATDEQIAQHIQAQELQGAMHIQSQGRNPSQVYYDYAKALGYKKSEPAPAAKEQPAPKPAAKPDKDAVRTMGSGGGDSAPPDERSNRDPMAELLGQVHGEITSKRRARRG